MKKNKICVIGVYFGKLPSYFNLWLQSCYNNPKIDFLIFTDQDLESNHKNVIFEKMTLKEMKKIAEKKLKMEISLEKPYKCCDFRPAYGVIFEDYLKGYCYWGHCDFDMIFGDIYSFIKKYDYEKYDKFLSNGHLSLYKNNDIINNAFKLPGSECGEYLVVFTNDKSYIFDELTGINKILIKNQFKVFDKRIFADISEIYSRFRLALDDKNYNNQIFYYEKGKIFRSYIEKNNLNKEEFIYIHFKRRNMYNLPQNKTSFYISKNGFYDIIDNVKIDEVINKYNTYNGKFYEKIELMTFYVKKKVKNLKLKLKKRS